MTEPLTQKSSAICRQENEIKSFYLQKKPDGHIPNYFKNLRFLPTKI